MICESGLQLTLEIHGFVNILVLYLHEIQGLTVLHFQGCVHLGVKETMKEAH